MAIDVHIEDGDGKGRKVTVSENGELITRPFDYSESSFRLMDTVDIAYNFQEPRPSQNFIITGLVVQANREVAVAGGNVIFYEANAADTTVATKTIFTFDLPRQDSEVITGVEIKVGTGKYLNGKTDDDDMLATFFGYYVPVTST